MKYAIILATLLLAGCKTTTQLTPEIIMPDAPEILNKEPKPLKTIRSVYPEKPAETVSPITPDVNPK